jgi:hypothetical protein
MREAQHGWLELDWFNNLPNSVEEVEEEEDGDDDYNMDSTEDIESHYRKRKRDNEQDEVVLGQRSGSGEMCMYAVDWLSEDRLRDFVKWKSKMLEEIELKGETIPSR